MLQEQYGVVPLFWVLLMWPMWSGILASFWHSKGWKIWKLPFAELAAVPRFQLLTRSIKAETCKRIHRPQYLLRKRKDRKDTAESRWNWKELSPYVPYIWAGKQWKPSGRPDPLGSNGGCAWPSWRLSQIKTMHCTSLYITVPSTKTQKFQGLRQSDSYVFCSLKVVLQSLRLNRTQVVFICLLGGQE